MPSKHRIRSRSPGPSSSSRRRSASPPPPSSSSRNNRYNDNDDRRRGGGDDRVKRGGSGYRDDRERYGERDDRDRRGGAGGGGGYGGRDRDRDRDDRRRSRSPGPSRAGGDGGWGKRAGGGGGDSPGRPSKALADQKDLVPGGEARDVGGKEPPKQVEPDYNPSGALAAETNTLNGVVLKYAEPPEARKPVRNWRLYVFKGKEQVELFHVHRQSAYLFGRDRIVADIPVDHPSTSKQHAVLQFRQVTERNEFGDSKSLTKPFIIDLDSANGTLVNDEQVPASRFYELRSGDVLKFAFSTREYVLLVES
ncbi:hypothetical protein JCM8547_005036 [Rhodosporidiobolus lusitaniae]